MTAGDVLRNARLAAGVTQAELGASAQYLQPAISRIERRGGASFDTIEQLLSAIGLRLIAVPLTRPTLADHAQDLRERLAAGKPTARALVEVTNSVLEADPSELPLIVATPPAPTNDSGLDAYLAGLVEHACGSSAPKWTREPARYCSEGWVLNPFPGDEVLDELIRSATPPAFARHGVFVDTSDLASV
jgi:transcriptional regulator with XRE-family HTH domain